MTEVDDHLAAGPGVDADDLARTEQAVLRGLFGSPDKATPARYSVERTLGRGAMGRVELAYDRELGRRVALKTVVPERAEDAASLARMKREAHALAQIDHPAVVGVHDLFESDGQVVIVMEYVQGPTLGAWLAESRPRAEVLAVLRAAAQGLAAAHRSGIVHRDFKPENVIVSGAGKAKVVDFGLARRGEAAPRSAPDLTAMPEVASSLTRTGAAVGTPAYMAPEQFLRGHADAYSDQFSFCVTAWESLTGARPFAGTSMEAVAMNMAEGNVDPSGLKALPRSVRAALLRGLQPEPQERHPDLDALADALAPTGLPRRAVGATAVGLGIVLAVAAASRPGEVGSPAAGGSEGVGGDAPSCAAAGESMREVWSDARRAEVTASILSAAPGYGDAFGDRYAQLVDGWVATWDARALQRCRATEDGSLSPELATASARCLDELREELDAQLRGVASMPAQRISRVVRRLDSLPRPRICLDPGTLRTRWGDPLTEAELAARAQRNDARALLATGDYPAALVAARAARAAVVNGENETLDAELALTLGRALFQAGETEPARRAFLDAANAAEGNRYDELATLAWLELVRVESLQDVDAEQASFFLERADAAVRRLGDPPRLRLVVHQRRAQAHVSASAFDAAEAELDAAEAAVASLDPSVRQRAELSVERGRVAYGRGELPRAIEAFSAAADGFEQWYGPHHPSVADAQHNLGSIMVAAGQLDDAVGVLDKALEGRKRSYGAEHEKVAGTLNSVASVAYMRGQYADALTGYTEVLRRRRSTREGPHATTAEALANVGRAHRGLGQHAEAAAAFEEAVTMLEGLFGPDHPRMAESLTGWATALDAAGDTAAALPLHERAMALRTANLGPSSPRTLQSTYNVGVCERKLGQLASARARAQHLLDATAGDPERTSLRAYAAFLAGWVEVDAGRPSLARRAFETGLSARAAAAEDAELDGEAAKARQWLEGRASPRR